MTTENAEFTTGPHDESNDLASLVESLTAERDKLSKALAGALSNLADAPRAQGAAEGKLAASEMSGVVEGWKARAERAEAEAERLRVALEGLVAGIDYLMDQSEGVYGLHLNGAPAPWIELRDGGDFEGWLCDLEPARAALEGDDNADQPNEKAPPTT